MDEINRLLQRVADLTTADYFPAIYDGFIEADALIQGEDSLLGVMREYVIQLWQNRNLLSMTEEKTVEFENRLHLTPSASQTSDDRRQAIADAINERFILNDESLHALCQSLATGFTVYERTDPRALTLGVFTTEDGEGGDLPAVGVVNGIRHIVPQNLALFAGVESQIECTAYANHAHFSSLRASLGEVEYRGDTTGFEEIAQPTVGYISQPETFLYIPQPEPGTMDARYSFTMIPQPTLATFARGDTFEAITQPTIGYMDIT